MERKSSQQYSGIFSVKGKKFKQRNLPSRTTSLLSSAANSVGTWLEFAAFGSRATPNIAELEHSGFFCPLPWFLLRSEHIFQGKTPSCLSIALRSINSWISIKISTVFIDITSVAEWLSNHLGASEPGRLDSKKGGEEMVFFFSFFFYYFSDGVFSEINKYQQKMWSSAFRFG